MSAPVTLAAVHSKSVVMLYHFICNYCLVIIYNGTQRWCLSGHTDVGVYLDAQKIDMKKDMNWLNCNIIVKNIYFEKLENI